MNWESLMKNNNNTMAVQTSALFHIDQISNEMLIKQNAKLAVHWEFNVC